MGGKQLVKKKNKKPTKTRATGLPSLKEMNQMETEDDQSKNNNNESIIQEEVKRIS